MGDEFQRHIRNGRTWRRGAFMLLFGIVLGPVKFLAAALAIFQFLSLLFTGTANARLARFGGSLAVYLYQITAYLTAHSDRRPFPFADWPHGVSLVEVEEWNGGADGSR